MSEDIKILRSLARRYAEAAADTSNAENAALYRAVNGLRMARPVVLIDEEPWSELAAGGELPPLCSDSDFRGAEHYMRRMLYKWEHHRADMIMPPYIPVYKMVGGSSGWLPVKETTVATDAKNHIVSHRYEDQLASAEDIEKLRLPSLTYRKAETEALAAKLNEAVGEIVSVRITGHNCYVCPWDNIAMYRGVSVLLEDIVERPEHTHAIMEKITQMYIEQYRQYEELGLFEPEPYLIHCTCALCDELKTPEGERTLRKNVWGRGMAQIFASVSPKMHREFDIDYQRRIMEPFGLVYYGCCEPLDKKMDVIKALPRLRKISVTPWADINAAAEAAGGDYVLSVKPNPASVGAGFDEENIKKELTALITACRRYNCSFELVLKDISTVNNRPSNLSTWEKTAMSLVRNL